MIWMLFACQGLPEFVTISGTVFESSAAEEPVAGVSLEVFDVAMESVDSVDADGEGAFSAQARMGSYFFLSMSADGYVPTGVAGSVGPQDFAIPDGALWMRTEEEHEEALVGFEGCEGLDSGGVIDGEVIMALPGEDDSLQKMFVSTGWARAILEDGTEVSACYLDDDGVYDPEAVYTGGTGQFVIPNVSGKIVLAVGYDLGESTMFEGLFTVYVPENGVTSLFDVLWMPLPQ